MSFSASAVLLADKTIREAKGVKFGGKGAKMINPKGEADFETVKRYYEVGCSSMLFVLSKVSKMDLSPEGLGQYEPGELQAIGHYFGNMYRLFKWIIHGSGRDVALDTNPLLVMIVDSIEALKIKDNDAYAAQLLYSSLGALKRFLVNCRTFRTFETRIAVFSTDPKYLMDAHNEALRLHEGEAERIQWKPPKQRREKKKGKQTAAQPPKAEPETSHPNAVPPPIPAWGDAKSPCTPGKNEGPRIFCNPMFDSDDQ